MRSTRWAMRCVVGCLIAVVALVSASGCGAGSGASAPERGNSGIESPLTSLVIPGAEPLVGSGQVASQEAVRHSSPEAFVARLRSRMAYTHLGPKQAAELALKAFPARTLGVAAPSSSAGKRVLRYLTPNAAAVELPGGKHAVVESLTPMAMQTSHGRFSALNLALVDRGSSYAPASSTSEVQIPKQLARGVELPNTGVSLVPVDSSGASLSGSQGLVDGAAVLYANTQPDTDTLVKPSSNGFELLAMLRSVDSASVLRYRVSVPAGAMLRQNSKSGAVDVMREGQAIASVQPPVAEDAEAASVPVTMSVEGDLLVLTVAKSSAYRYPIAVDPFVSDERFTGLTTPTRWKFCASDDISCTGHTSAKFESKGWGGTGGLTIEPTGSYAANEWVSLNYQTQGESKIDQLGAEASGSTPSGDIESYSQVFDAEKVEGTNTIALPPSTGYTGFAGGVCPRNGGGEQDCSGASSKEKNAVRYELSSTGPGTTFWGALNNAYVQISQAKNPEDSLNTGSSTLTGGLQNVLYGEGFEPTRWLGPHANTGFEVIAKDAGIGISSMTVGAAGWGLERAFLSEGRCEGVQCFPSVNEIFTYTSGMTDGAWNVKMLAQNATVGGFGNEAIANVHVDATPPFGLRVLGLPSSNIIDGVPYHLTAEAIDGSGTTMSSGVKSLALGIDGLELTGGKSGSCPQGPCTATGEWTINGEEFGAGKHTLELVATDYAGNVETKPYEITVRHAAPVKIHPGEMDPITGALMLEANDVMIASGYGDVKVARTFNSRQLQAGTAGPLGPQWNLVISGEQGIENEAVGGAVNLVGPDGSRTTFLSDGKGGFVSPKGDANLVLTAEREVETVTAYLLEDVTKGTKERFIHPPGAASTSMWVIEKAEGVLSKENGEKQTYAWETLEESGTKIERPKQALAPAPEVSCEPELKAGCRALSFTYATETTATGEAPSQWGQYKGRLIKVSLTAYNTESKTMVTTAVAEYAYDKLGRLRAEWDPRISPALKLTYGYDSENHVVSVNPAGQEPWLLHYGTIPSDANRGRLLSVIRPGASTALGNSAAPANETKPTLSTTTPVIGTTMSVSSNGTWSNSPLAYEYQWNSCDFKGEKCAAILGAVNQSYTPQARDAGNKLTATVTAINADGAGTSTTSATSTIVLTAAKYSLKFGSAGEGSGQVKNPIGLGVDSSGNVWVADHNNNRLDKFSGSGTFVEAVGWGVSNGEAKLQTCTASCRAGINTGGIGFNGSFTTPDGLAIAEGNIYVADAGDNRIEEMNTKAEFVRSFATKGSGPGQVTNPVAVAVAPNGDVWVADRGNNRIDEFSETGTYLGTFGSAGTGNGQFKEPAGVAFAGEYAYVVDAGNSRVQQFTQSGVYVGQFGTAGSGNGQFSAPGEIVVEPVSGDLMVADSGNNRVQEFTQIGGFLASVGSVGETEGKFKGVEGIVASSTGNLYAADLNNNRIQEFTPGYSSNNPAPAPPSVGTSAVATIDYKIPVSGAGAPYALGSTENEAWAQTDDPVEATAIFPPDEPMGWPAQDYKRASISYMDQYGRPVNLASPSGGVATTEYSNETSNVVRTLSANNRAKALSEGAKSAEVSKLLDTKNTYNGAGTELTSVVGPEHKVRLANGSEPLAREHTQYVYEEGAPEGGPFYLVTKVKEWAQYSGGEADTRTTLKSYSGQENLGWKLHVPTSVTTDSTGQKLVQSTYYDPSSGRAVETRGPAATQGSFPAGAYGYANKLTTGGTVSPFSGPNNMAFDKKGNLWVAETSGNRVQEYAASGELILKFGTVGTENGQFKEPRGIVVDSKENVWVTDTGNNRVEEFSSTGTYISKFGSLGAGNGQFKEATGITVDPKGKLWVVDTGNSRVQEFSATGTYEKQFGTAGTENGKFKEPFDMAVDSKENIWVTDSGNHRVQEFSIAGTYLGQFGTSGTENGQFKFPKGITIDSGGHIWVADYSNNRVQEFSSTGTYMSKFGTVGTKAGQLLLPKGIAVDASGNVWVSNTNGSYSVEEFTGTGEYIRSPFTTTTLEKPAGVTVAKEKVWVADTAANRIEVYTLSGAYLMGFGSAGTENGKFKEPKAIAVDNKNNVWVLDTGNNRVQEFNEAGEYLAQFGSAGTENGKFKEAKGIAVDTKEHVWVADGGNNRVQEFSFAGTYLNKFGTSGTGEGQFKTPIGIAVDATGNVWVSDSSNNRIEEFSSAGAFLSQFGSAGAESGQLLIPTGIAFDPSGHLWVGDVLGREQEFTTSGEYIRQFGKLGTENGQLKGATGIFFDPSADAWVADSGNNRIQEFSPIAGGYHASQTFYYTAKNNPEMTACGKHPEWAGLPCRSQPAKQPVTGAKLPVVTDTYNMWDETEAVTEEFGSVTRKKVSKYDPAGRVVESEITSTIDTALPKVVDEYSPETGAMIKKSTTVSEKTQTVTSVDNKLGQLIEYTDADGNKATYKYTVDGQVEEMNDGKGSQVYAYDSTTEDLTKLLDISAGTFTATYDAEGQIKTETYPNGMTAKYEYDAIGEVAHLEYVKETHCTEKCVWFSEGVSYSIHGEALQRSSSLATDVFTYDGAERLTQAQETPAGLGCKVRVYAYDQDSNRLSLTSREPGAEGKCATTGGTVETHTYDEADRLTDAGTTYETFGNATAVPAADAGGHEVTNSYYVSNQARSTVQNGETITYNLDPEGRSREVVSTGTTNSTAVNHYVGPDETIAWSAEGGEKYTRNIPGIDGTLSATQQNGETPVLQVHDLQDNIVATAALGELETKFLSTYNSTEFGVPSTGTAPKYSWLGATGVTAEFGTGINASHGSGYIPQLGAALQTQPVSPPGVVPPGTWASGPYTSNMEAWVGKSDAAWGAESTQRQAARELAAQEAAFRLAIDPPMTFYYSAYQAERVGKVVEGLGSLGEYLDFVVAVPEGLIKLAEGFVLEKLDGVSKAFEWFKDTGKKLIRCGKESIVCQFTFDVWEVNLPALVWEDSKLKLTTINLKFVNVFSAAVVNWCLGTVRKPGACFKSRYF
jgi:YD repeat-containing protein